MDHTISNGIISLTVAELGAEMMSLKKDGCEYLWQGNPEFWASRACNLFPICGRLTDGKYTYKGNTYEMILHGFAKKSLFTVESKSADSIVFLLKANDETKAIYPFDFEYRVTYTLKGDTVEMKYSAKNNGDNTMYFAFGGHPGFNVPLDNGTFADYYVEFAEKAPAEKLLFNSCFTTDCTEPFVLKDGRHLDLKHDLFDNDAIFITKMCDTVTLKSDKSSRSVTVYYPDMKYLGFWHKPETEAPYVCIEPWMSVPAYYKIIDDMETKRDMKALEKGEIYSTHIDITLK